MVDSDGDKANLRVRQFGELLAACHRDLFAFIYSLVQHHADAEDVYQRTTLTMWSKFDSFEIGTNFGAWATKVAHNTAREFIRSRKRNALTFSDEVLDAIAAAYSSKGAWRSDGVSEALGLCLDKLSERDRRLVERCYSADRDFTTIATEEDRTVGALYQAICRIRKNLYACIKRTLSQEPG